MAAGRPKLAPVVVPLGLCALLVLPEGQPATIAGLERMPTPNEGLAGMQRAVLVQDERVTRLLQSGQFPSDHVGRPDAASSKGFLRADQQQRRSAVVQARLETVPLPRTR